MSRRVKAVVIGGGIVGVSVLYHLAKLGWRDLLLVERRELTSGSTWHAAAGFHAINGDPNVARLQAYTIGLYREVEELSERSCGLHMTGGLVVAATAARWDWLKAEWARQQMIGLHSRLVTPKEIKDLCPLLETDAILGGLFDANEGHLDPNGATYAFAKAAQKLGARIQTQTSVIDLKPQSNGAWIVVTDKGDIEAEHVINAAGLWAPRIGDMIDVRLPIVPMEHMYVVTEPLSELADVGRELPMTADLDAHVYFRQEQKSVLLGVYEEDPRHWSIDGVPWDFGMELIPPDLDRIAEPLANGFARLPALQNAGIKRVVNGGMVFSPDGNPIVGPVSGVRNYWCACGSMAGFSQTGGIGKTLAEWMVHGEPEGDVFAMDVNRFGPHVTKQYLLEKTRENYARRFKLTCPNEQLTAGRPLKTGPLHSIHITRNAVFGAAFGLEFPMVFAGDDAFQETPTLRRSNAHELAAAEANAARRSACVFDLSSYGKYRVRGTNAERWVSNLFAGLGVEPGELAPASLLSEAGRLLGEFTALRIAADDYVLIASGYMQAIHMRWFAAHAGDGVRVENVSESMSGLGVYGPEALRCIESAMGSPLPSQSVAAIELGLAPALLARNSIIGEDGVEIYADAPYMRSIHAALHRGQDVIPRPVGIYAMNALRVENAHPVWGRELSQDYTLSEAGLADRINTAAASFVGREAAMRILEAPPARRLVTLIVDAIDADASGFEPIWRGDHLAGFTTSGAFGHTLDLSLGLGYVDASFAKESQRVDVHIVGERRSAVVTLKPALALAREQRERRNRERA